jgi:VanZ family protein
MDMCEICLILIILYVNLFHTDICDWYLSKVIIKNPRITLWNVTHFITYTVLGLLYPMHYKMYVCLGILWELFEFTIGFFDKRGRSYWTSGGLSGQVTDVIANIIGLYLGKWILNYNYISTLF